MRNLKGTTKKVLSFALAFLMIVSTIFVCDIQTKAEATDVEDTTAPIITSISIDKQGETLEEGKVTITYTAWDESGFKEGFGSSVELKNPCVNNNEYSFAGAEEVSCSEDGKTKTFSLSFWIDDLPAGEYYINGITVIDSYMNSDTKPSNSLGPFDNYYFYVAGEYAEPTYENVTVSLVDKDGKELVVSDAKTLPRRATLSDVFGEQWIDSLADDEILGKFVGWRYRSKFVSKDSEIYIFNGNRNYDIEPVYEMQEVSVFYDYVDEELNVINGGEDTKAIVIAPYDACMQEILDLVEVPEVPGMKHVGWKGSYGSVNLWDVSLDGNYISNMEAVYDKALLSLSLTYIDENNNVCTDDVKKIYEIGTNVQEAVDDTLKNLDSSISQNVSEWEASIDYSDNILENWEEVSVQANYENKAYIYLWAWEEGDNWPSSYGVYAGNHEEYFYLPDGYFWYVAKDYCYYTGSFFVPNDTTEFVLEGFTSVEDDDTVIRNPEKPAEDDPVVPPAEDDPVVPPAGDEEEDDPVDPPAGDEEEDDPVDPPAGDGEEDDPVDPPMGDDEDKNDYSAKFENESEVADKVELTEDEKTAIANGEKLEIVLGFKDAGASAITDEQKSIEKEIGNKKIGTFLDIDLIKKIGTTEVAVSETTGLVAITFEIPAELKNTDSSVIRTYSVMRYHDGKVDTLDAKYDAEKGTITFETDKFSTYAVVYSDATYIPNMGDASVIYVMCLVLGAGFIFVALRKQKRI